VREILKKVHRNREKMSLKHKMRNIHYNSTSRNRTQMYSINLKSVNLASSHHKFRKADHTIVFSSKPFCKKSGFQRQNILIETDVNN
jgi:hypothetical protein